MRSALTIDLEYWCPGLTNTTDSPFMLRSVGIVGLRRVVPVSFPTGLVSDCLSRHSPIVIANTVLMPRGFVVPALSRQQLPKPPARALGPLVQRRIPLD